MNGKHKYGYFFLRLPIAMSLLGHGLVRLPKLQGFSNWIVFGNVVNAYSAQRFFIGQ